LQTCQTSQTSQISPTSLTCLISPTCPTRSERENSGIIEVFEGAFVQKRQNPNSLKGFSGGKDFGGYWRSERRLMLASVFDVSGVVLQNVLAQGGIVEMGVYLCGANVGMS
jgi:hypothetical protein